MPAAKGATRCSIVSSRCCSACLYSKSDGTVWPAKRLRKRLLRRSRRQPAAPMHLLGSKTAQMSECPVCNGPSAHRSTHTPFRFALPHLERPNVPQMLLFADTILSILSLLFARPFSFWICRMHGSWRRRRVIFLLCWVPFSGFVVLDSFMSGYGALSSYSGFAVTLQLCFFALSLLGALFPSVMLRTFRWFGFGIHATLWVAAVVPFMNESSLSCLSQQYNGTRQHPSFSAFS
jgi:hypothetical protein